MTPHTRLDQEGVAVAAAPRASPTGRLECRVPDSPSPALQIAALRAWFEACAAVRVACSGGIDSLLLAHLAHEVLGASARIVHAVSAAVPPAATERVLTEGRAQGWSVELIDAGEFDDERYVANPVDRCFYCKTRLYAALERIGHESLPGQFTVSGTNVDDLGEYRPGLTAAKAFGVRHPYVETGVGKADIRAMARVLRRPYAELPASPCLSSRLYTGTRVTPERVRFVDRAEQLVRTRTGSAVVRCRLDGDTLRLELPGVERARADSALLDALRAAAAEQLPEIRAVVIDERGYAPGRAFVGAPR